MSDAKTLRLIANGLCALGATATVAGYLSIFVRSGGSLGAYAALFCGWGLIPYVASLVISHVAARYRIAATAALSSSLLISAVGLIAITVIHRNTMMLVRDPEAMNCVGPVFELGAPLVQLAMLVPVGLFAAAGRGRAESCLR